MTELWVLCTHGEPEEVFDWLDAFNEEELAKEKARDV